MRDLITEIELSFPVNEWEVKGIKIWPLIRIKLSYLLAYKAAEADIETSIQTLSIFQVIIRVLRSPFLSIYHALMDWKSSANPVATNDVVFIGDGVSFTKIDEQWFEILCDPLRIDFKQNNYSSIKFETWTKYYRPRFMPSFIVQPLIDWTIILDKIRFSKPKVDSKLESYPQFLAFLNDNQIALTGFNEGDITKHIKKIDSLAKMYSFFLKKIKPKAGMLVCYYGDYMLGFTLACKRLNIPTFDIQHGVQGEKHRSYGGWHKVPKNGYELLPNYFLCWSDYDASTINKWSGGINNHKALVIGNRFLEMWRNPASELGVKYDQIFNRIYDPAKLKILLTLSWDVSSEKHIASTLGAMKHTQHDYLWLIRLHPSMIHQKQEIIQMFHDHEIVEYELEEATALPLYAVMRNVHMNITHSSSTIIEAAEFGVPSIITSDYGWQLQYNESIAKWISKADKSEEIIDFLAKIIPEPNKRDLENAVNSTYINQLTEMIN